MTPKDTGFFHEVVTIKYNSINNQPVKVKIKGNAQWLNKWEFAAPTSKLNKQTPRDLEKEVYDGNITDKQNGTDAIRVSELKNSRQR